MSKEPVVSTVKVLLIVKAILLRLDRHLQVIVIPIIVELDDHSETVREDQKTPGLFVVHHQITKLPLVMLIQLLFLIMVVNMSRGHIKTLNKENHSTCRLNMKQRALDLKRRRKERYKLIEPKNGLSLICYYKCEYDITLRPSSIHLSHTKLHNRHYEPFYNISPCPIELFFGQNRVIFKVYFFT